MKRELDPFESKLKEKLQGKASFPEDILWKRLNDELIRSDQKVLSKNYYWIIGTALLVLISLGTGYFIGVRQGASKLVATKNINDLREKGMNPKSQLSSIQNKNRSAQTEDVKLNSPEKVQALQNKTLSEIQLPVGQGKPAQQHKDHLSTLNGILVNDSRNQSISINKQVDFLATVPKLEKTNQDSNALSVTNLNTASQNNPSDQVTAPFTNLLLEQSNMLHLDVENDFNLEKLSIKPIALLQTSTSTSLAKGIPYKRHLPTFLSASFGFEPTAFNRLKQDDIYGLGTSYSSNEKGLSSMNVKLGFQAQLGRHLELGIGIGSLNYLSQQNVKNQIVQIDPLVNQLNFESTIGSFHIHEDHLMDDPEDQEENELNFQDSTSFHLNYQLSNSVKSIQVPLTAGFVFQLNKIKFTIKTGLIYNHITQANQIINIQGFNTIRNNVSSQLVSNSYFHLLQIGAEYPVSKHFSIMLAPKYSYALKSISKSTILRPNSIGLECAMKFYF